jgi:arylsulfatase A-like enzyme
MKILPLFLALACLLVVPVSAADAVKPNILFILVDDFGARDLGCYGSALYETPHLDRLAQSGARFTQAYTAYPRCVPSRFAYFTGKHPARIPGGSPHVEPGRDVVVAQPFKAAGYATFYAGKWHIGTDAAAPEKVGFDTVVATGGGAAGATRSHFAPYAKQRRPGGGNEKEAAITDLADAPEGEYLTDRLTTETMKFIAANKDRPFFAVLAHYAVHTPIEAKADLTKRYREKIAGQPAPATAYEKESAGENLVVQNNATYAAMIASTDEGVGRLLDQLKQLGIDDRTIIVLASDHGGLSARGNQREVATSNRPLRAGKGHLYEGGLRIPFLVRWPGHTKPGREIATPVSSLDLFPTFLDMAQLPAPAGFRGDGLSLAGLLSGGAAPGRDSFYWNNPAPRPTQTADWLSSAIRVGDWKLIEFPEQKKIELYDLSQDAGESTNLAEQRPADAARLLAKLNSWKREVGLDKPGRPAKGKGK